MELDDLVESLKQLGEKSAAITVLEALGRHSNTFTQYDTLARCFFKIKAYKHALTYAEQAVLEGKTNEEKYTARTNLVNVYAHAYEPEKALDLIDVLEKIKPNDSDTRLKKAYALFLMGRRDEAEKILREELVNPETTEKVKNEIEFNLGTYEMYRDNFYEGLYRFLIHGRRMSLWEKPKLPFDEWDQRAHPGHVIVLRAEAGIGDEFINIRFMRKFEQLGMIPIWYTDRTDMRDLFNRLGYTAVSSLEELMKHDNGLRPYWCHSMDVPVLLNLEYKDLWEGPYISADPTITDLHPKLSETGRLKIGIRWQGNPDYDNDLHRSVPLDELYNVVSKYDADIFSLQRDFGEEEILEYPDVVPLYKTGDLASFERTLAVINKLDVVITSCTSIAHAAAAMGKTTIVFSPMSSYYVWCHSDKYKHSPWYGEHVNLLRQRRPRYWDEPLAELAARLNELLPNKS